MPAQPGGDNLEVTGPTRRLGRNRDVTEVALDRANADAFAAEGLDAVESGLRTGNGGHDTDVMRVGSGANLVLVLARNHAARCIDDELDLPVLDHVDRGRPAFVDLGQTC